MHLYLGTIDASTLKSSCWCIANSPCDGGKTMVIRETTIHNHTSHAFAIAHHIMTSNENGNRWCCQLVMTISIRQYHNVSL